MTSFISEFVNRTEHTAAPKIYRRWSGILCVAAALQRRSYLMLRGRQLYANIFAFLVGPPGVGKTTAIREAREILKHVNGVRMFPPKITPERFINKLSSMHTQQPPGPGEVIGTRTASATALLDELSVFIRPKDYDFMGILTDLFDCPPLWEYSTLARDEDRCENVHLNIIGGITPKSIAENLGPQAFGLGFTSRVIFVWADALEEQNDLFALATEPDRQSLIEDARRIHKIAGEFKLTKEAVEFSEDWHRKKMTPYPIDARFIEYLPRRIIHWLKLGLIFSAARSSERIITLDDMQQAKETLLEVEALMPFAVELVGKNPIHQALEDLHRWMHIRHAETRKPIPESAIRNKLLHFSVPLQLHGQAIEILLNTNRIDLAPIAMQLASPNRVFVPLRLDA